MLTGARRGSGFTLIELMIGLAIVGLLLMLAYPAFSTMLNNQRLRATAEALMNGLQNARTEAVKRNGRVDFVMFNEAIDATDYTFINSVTPVVGGTNWAVRALVPATGLYEFVEAKPVSAGSAAIQVAGGAASISFNGLGQTTMAAAATFQFSNPPAGACAPTGPMRCLNVVVSPGGQARMCDPAVPTTANDTRRC